MNGTAEKKTREIKALITKLLENEGIPRLQWNALASERANTINDLPLALGNIASQFENMDLLTPNRLHLTRNNDQSSVGPMMVTNNPKKFLFINEKLFYMLVIQNVGYVGYFSCTETHDHPKWFQTDKDVKVENVVLFLKQDNQLSSTYQYGMISELSSSSDDKIRKATVRYRKSTEAVNLLIVQCGS